MVLKVHGLGLSALPGFRILDEVYGLGLLTQPGCYGLTFRFTRPQTMEATGTDPPGLKN